MGETYDELLRAGRYAQSYESHAARQGQLTPIFCRPLPLQLLFERLHVPRGTLQHMLSYSRIHPSILSAQVGALFFNSGFYLLLRNMIYEEKQFIL